MPDRRRQRQQRVRHDAGGPQNPVGASNRDPEPEKEPTAAKVQRQGGSGVAYAEPKQYESVTIMPDKEVKEPQKYQRGSVLSNWSRYEEMAANEPEDGEDYMIGEDFAEILEQQANSAGSHLRLKGEMDWEDEEASILASHGLGALHVADLVAAINTLPLYTQLNISEDSLPDSVVEFYTQLADDNCRLYKPNKEYKDCSEIHEKLLQSLKISEAEPLALITDENLEETENIPSTKTAVDVALSLTEAFAPEPEDVDLNTLLQAPGVEKDATPPREPSPVKSQPFVTENRPKLIKEDSPKPVKENSPKPVTKENGPKAIVKENNPKPVAKEKSPKPQPATNGKPDKNVSRAAKLNEKTKNKPVSEPPKAKGPGGFDFGLSKVNSATAAKKAGQDAKAAVMDISDLLEVEEAKEETQGPAVDLDAPIEHEKPVIVSKTETEDLEDWLDSVLDD